MSTNLTQFLVVYPEFNPVFATDTEAQAYFDMLFSKLQCTFPEYSNLATCNIQYPFYMIVAHNLVMDGYGKSIGILPQNGSISSSTVGGVSVGYQANPYGQDSFSYYLSLSKYGREYLAWLQRQAGLLYAN